MSTLENQKEKEKWLKDNLGKQEQIKPKPSSQQEIKNKALISEIKTKVTI